MNLSNFNPFKKTPEVYNPKIKFLTILFALGVIKSVEGAAAELPKFSSFEGLQDMKGKTELMKTSLYEKMLALNTDTIEFDKMDTIQTSHSSTNDSRPITEYDQNLTVEKKHVVVINNGTEVTVTESANGHKVTLKDSDNDNVVNEIKVENFSTNSKRLNATHTFEIDKDAIGGTNTHSSIQDLSTLEGKVAFDQTQKKWFQLIEEANEYAAQQLEKTSENTEQASIQE